MIRITMQNGKTIDIELDPPRRPSPAKTLKSWWARASTTA